MTVTSREFQDDNVQRNGSVSGNAVAVEATGVILTAKNLGSSLVAVAAHGDIDVRSAPGLENFACAQVAAGLTVVLDLTDVDFFGIAGLAVFEALDATCAQIGAEWVLCSGRPVSRLLQAAGRSCAVRGFASIDDAIDAVM